MIQFSGDSVEALAFYDAWNAALPIGRNSENCKFGVHVWYRAVRRLTRGFK
jgi:hypothetical protein